MIAPAPANTAPPLPAYMPGSVHLGYALPFLVLTVCLLFTHRLYLNAQQNEVHKLQAEFDFHVRDVGNRVEQRMAAYEQVLRGVSGLFAASVSVEREEFHDYIARLRLEESYPGIQGVGFALIVPPEQKNRHITAMRKQGFPEYTIHPEGECETCTSVIYIEPFNERNRRALGYDMYSDREQPSDGDSAPGLRRAAMERARDSGKAAISGKIRLLMETKTDRHTQAGVLMYLPVYRNGAPLDTLAARRANIVGWVYAPFRMDNLMAGILAEHPAELDIEIFDGEELSDRALLYDDDKSRHAGGKLGSQFQAIKRIEAAGRTWTRAIHSLPGFEALLDKEKPKIIANTGIGISLLLALLTGLLVYGRARALKTARDAVENEARLKDVFEHLRSGVAVYRASSDGQGFIITAFNLAAEQIENTHREDVVGKNVAEVFPGITEFGLLEVFKRVWKSGVAEHFPISFYKDGRIGGWRENYVYKLPDGEIVAIYDDITERKQAEEQEHYLANHDTLTGLPNRALLNDRISQAIIKARRDKVRMALMFIDLDNFKPVNDDLGHDIGDQVLQEAAKRLQDCMRESDTAARIGGDEFIVLLPAIEAEQDAMAVAEKIRHALCQPFELAGHSICISSSIGIAVYHEHGGDGELLTKNADIAMYHAKKNGRNNVQFYHFGMKECSG